MSFLKKFIFKRLLLGVAVAGMVLNVHAQWDKKWLYYVGAAYPFTQSAAGFLLYCAEGFVQLGDELSGRVYPRALGYVRAELRAAGRDPAKICVRDVPTHFSCVTPGRRHMFVPLASIENVLKKRELSQPLTDNEVLRYLIDQAAIAHEIGHMRNCQFIWRVLLPFTATIATCRATTQMRNPLARESLRFFVPMAVTSLLCHIDEYRADSYKIKRFKREPDKLLAGARYMLDLHAHYGVMLRSPVFLTMQHWLFDTHGSPIARVNRFLKAAGVPSCQHALCYELTRQKRDKVGRVDVDMDCIISSCKEFSKNCAAVELPEPLETYGQ